MILLDWWTRRGKWDTRWTDVEEDVCRLTKLIKNMILIGLACFMALIIMVISWFHCQIGGHYLILSIITPLSVVLFVINLDLKIWLFYLTRVAWVSCRGYFLHVSLYRRKCANTAQVRGTQIKFTSRTVMNLSLCTSRCTLSSAWRQSADRKKLVENSSYMKMLTTRSVCCTQIQSRWTNVTTIRAV